MNIYKAIADLKFFLGAGIFSGTVMTFFFLIFSTATYEGKIYAEINLPIYKTFSSLRNGDLSDSDLQKKTIFIFRNTKGYSEKVIKNCKLDSAPNGEVDRMVVRFNNNYNGFIEFIIFDQNKDFLSKCILSLKSQLIENFNIKLQNEIKLIKRKMFDNQTNLQRVENKLKSYSDSIYLQNYYIQLQAQNQEYTENLNKLTATNDDIFIVEEFISAEPSIRYLKVTVFLIISLNIILALIFGIFYKKENL